MNKTTQQKMKEEVFQDLMLDLINSKLDTSKFICRKGAAILYTLTVNEDLNVVGNPKNPKRGQGAFQTDLVIFAKKNTKLEIPFIIIEIKSGISSHDIIIYSNKASRHKLVYPYLRYGLITYDENNIPKKFFRHNEGIDFFLAIKDYLNDKEKLKNILHNLIQNELKIFEEMQKILHSNEKLNFYQNTPQLKNFQLKS